MKQGSEIISVALADARKETGDDQYKTGLFLALAFEDAGITDVEMAVLGDYLRMHQKARRSKAKKNIGGGT